MSARSDALAAAITKILAKVDADTAQITTDAATIADLQGKVGEAADDAAAIDKAVSDINAKVQ